ncbi:MAG: isopentenyl phosphate kinase [Candidatus Moranbacteria bacterium]|nr:isopentenyl phosphate kinase [Candidatus Moranbacteria bacterium]MDD3964651.1 isopentenyl phosphate kinase [Candidatus Moranbacteria bacterium]
MKNSHLTILKIGGSCITYKDQSQARLRRNFLRRMAIEISLGMHKEKSSLIIVHGGGGMTHPLLDRYGLVDTLKTGIISTKQDKIAAAKIHLAMNELNNRVTKSLQDAGIPAWPIQTSAITVSFQKNTPKVFLDAIRTALSLDIVPVLHGDLILDSEKGSRIFSGDALACLLSRDLHAEKLLFMSDVDGIYGSSEDIQKKIHPLPVFSTSDSQMETFVSNRLKGIDHSGGMIEKIYCIQNICSDSQVRIFSGLIEGNITKALLGESIGTEIVY